MEESVIIIIIFYILLKSSPFRQPLFKNAMRINERYPRTLFKCKFYWIKLLQFRLYRARDLRNSNFYFGKHGWNRWLPRWKEADVGAGFPKFSWVRSRSRYEISVFRRVALSSGENQVTIYVVRQLNDYSESDIFHFTISSTIKYKTKL